MSAASITDSLPKTLDAYWERQKGDNPLFVITEQSVEVYPGWGREIVIQHSDNKLYLAFYSIGEDSTDGWQSLRWRPCHAVHTTRYEAT